MSYEPEVRRRQIVREYRKRFAADKLTLIESIPEMEGATPGGVKYSEAFGLFAEAQRTVNLSPRARTPGQARSTLEHEAVHAELHHQPVGEDDNERAEWIADTIAAQRLIPVEKLAEAIWGWLLFSTDRATPVEEMPFLITTLAGVCEVDTAMLITRLKLLGRAESAYVAEAVMNVLTRVIAERAEQERNLT